MRSDVAYDAKMAIGCNLMDIWFKFTSYSLVVYYLLCIISPDKKVPIVTTPDVLCFLPFSGCLVVCLCLSVFTLLLQSLWVPPEITRDELTWRSPEEQGNKHMWIMMEHLYIYIYIPVFAESISG